MHSTSDFSGQRRRWIAVATLLTFTWLGVSSDTATAQTRKINDAQAAEIALAAVPGEVMDIAIERKMGDKRIVVEVIAAADMVETDVIIDMVTGKVLGTEK